jgi:hypothetical protein
MVEPSRRDFPKNLTKNPQGGVRPWARHALTGHNYRIEVLICCQRLVGETRDQCRVLGKKSDHKGWLEEEGKVYSHSIWKGGPLV